MRRDVRVPRASPFGFMGILGAAPDREAVPSRIPFPARAPPRIGACSARTAPLPPRSRPGSLRNGSRPSARGARTVPPWESATGPSARAARPSGEAAAPAPPGPLSSWPCLSPDHLSDPPAAWPSRPFHAQGARHSLVVSGCVGDHPSELVPHPAGPGDPLLAHKVHGPVIAHVDEGGRRLSGPDGVVLKTGINPPEHPHPAARNRPSLLLPCHVFLS